MHIVLSPGQCRWRDERWRDATGLLGWPPKTMTWIFWDWGCLDITCRTMSQTWTRTGHLWRFCFWYPTSWSLWYCRLLWRVKGGETQSFCKSDALYTCQEGCSISDCKFSMSLSPLQSFASNIHMSNRQKCSCNAGILSYEVVLMPWKHGNRYGELLKPIP